MNDIIFITIRCKNIEQLLIKFRIKNKQWTFFLYQLKESIQCLQRYSFITVNR